MAMKKRKITKKEKKYFIGVILTILAWALLYTPISSLLDSLKISNVVRLILGLLVILGILKIFDIV